MPQQGTKFKGNNDYWFDRSVSRHKRKPVGPRSHKTDRDALRAERAKVRPGDWSAQNTAPEFVPETFWGRVKREYRAVRAHARNWTDRMAERAANNAAARRIMREEHDGDRIFRDAGRYTPRTMSEVERARFVDEGLVQRETLEWRRKTNRNMLTGEHLSGMPIDRFDEFPEGNPYVEGESCALKWGRQPLDVEEGRPHEPSKFDPVTHEYKGRLPKGADKLRDPHGRDADGWVRMSDGKQVHCGTGSIFGPDGRTRINRFTRDEHFEKVILKGLTPEEAAAHRAEREEHDAVMHDDAKAREWAERYAPRHA